MKRSILLAAAGVALFASAPAAQAGGTVYRAPYKAGPVSGAARQPALERVDVNTSTGQVTVFRANGTPAAIGCAATGGYGYLRVEHPATSADDDVYVAYEKASITPFTWLKVNVRGVVGGVEQYIGSAALRGQLVSDSGVLSVDLDQAPDAGSVMTIDFGIETASACPNADGGTATFTAVAVV